MAIQATEESVEKRQQELEKIPRGNAFDERNDATGNFEQRLLAQSMHRKRRKSSDIPQPSMAGDLEDDDEDDDGLLHDRESWGI